MQTVADLGGGHGAAMSPSGRPVIFQHVIYDENNSLVACRSSSKQFKQIVGIALNIDFFIYI